MSFAVHPFTPDHLDAAAALLAGRQRVDRRAEPRLPARYEDPTVARAAIEAALAAPRTTGAVALRDGRVAGYLLGSVQLTSQMSGVALFRPSRAAEIPEAGYAADGADAFAIYRALYATLAPGWLAAGCIAHYVPARPIDRTALRAWTSLEFARTMVSGLRGLEPVERTAAPAGVTIARASTEDIDAVFGLIRANLRFHAGSPMFDPYIAETEADVRAMVAAQLATPEETAIWLAEREGRTVAVQTFLPRRERMTAPDRSVYLQHGYTSPDARGGGVGTALLAEGVTWAREAGHEACLVAWHTANPLGARFWRESGFAPIGYGLVRRFDERLTWGDGR